MSTPRTRLRWMGEKSRAEGQGPLPGVCCDPRMQRPADSAYLDGWLGDSWRRRLFGTNFCRVLIMGTRLLVLPDRREDLFARSAA